MANREPGSEWFYFTAGVVVLGDILDKHVKGGLEKYADAKLFKPLGITNYKWQYTPQKVVNTAGGLGLSSLDLAKFGQLYLNKGNWSGQQILTEAWVKESHTKQIAVPMYDMSYGFLFWNRLYKGSDASYESFYCSGNGGNKVHVFKELNMVVVITAKAYNTPYMHPQADKIIEKYLLPAISK
jgi:CubicO group peptidase (beta-lactamase class C family)